MVSTKTLLQGMASPSILLEKRVMMTMMMVVVVM
jgi:hypothetical protein